MNEEVEQTFEWIRRNWYELPRDMWLGIRRNDIVAMAQSAERLRTMLEGVPNVVIVLRHDGKEIDREQPRYFAR